MRFESRLRSLDRCRNRLSARCRPQCGGRPLLARALRHAIFQQPAGNANGVEPCADLRAFKVDGQDVIAPAGADQDGRAGVLVRRWTEQSEGGFGDVAQAHNPFARYQAIRGRRGVRLGRDIAMRARRSARRLESPSRPRRLSNQLVSREQAQDEETLS